MNQLNFINFKISIKVSQFLRSYLDCVHSFHRDRDSISSVSTLQTARRKYSKRKNNCRQKMTIRRIIKVLGFRTWKQSVATMWSEKKTCKLSNFSKFEIPTRKRYRSHGSASFTPYMSNFFPVNKSSFNFSMNMFSLSFPYHQSFELKQFIKSKIPKNCWTGVE